MTAFPAKGSFDRRIAVLALATFASGTEAYVYAGLLSDVAHDLHVDLAGAGLLATAFAVTYAVLAPLLASLTAHLPRRALLTAGLAALGAINLAASLAPSFGWLVASRIACGAIAALVGPSASAAASALVPPEARGRAMAMVSAGLSLAFTLGVPLGSAIGGAFGWRATFVFAGLLLLACALAIRLVIPSISATDRTGLLTLAVGLKPAVLRPLLTTLAAFSATFASVAYLGPTANAVAGAHGLGVGLFQACIGIGSVAGILLGGRLADSSNRRRFLPALFAVIVATQLGYVAAQHNGLATAAAALVLALTILVGAAALFAIMPIVQVNLVEAAPENRNVALALNGSMVFLGQGLGAALGAGVILGDRLAHAGLAGATIALIVALGMAIGRAHRTARTEPGAKPSTARR